MHVSTLLEGTDIQDAVFKEINEWIGEYMTNLYLML